MTSSGFALLSPHTCLLLFLAFTTGSAAAAAARLDPDPIDAGALSGGTIQDQESIHSELRSRSLALGDFEHFNELFADAKIDLGTHELGGTGASLTIQNLFCSNIEIGDIQTSHTVFPDAISGNDILQYTAIVRPFSIECQADYAYRLIGIPGGGKVTATAIGNELETRVHLLSPSTFANEPPVSSEIDYCLGKIDTNGNVNFEGDFIGDVLNMFRNQVSSLIDDLAAKAACDELAGLGPEFFGKLLNQTKTQIDEWLLPLPAELADPLYPEKNFTATNTAKLVSFRSSDNVTSDSVADLFASLLSDNDAIFGSKTVDSVTGETGLGINAFIRDSILDENRELLLEPEELGGNFDPIIFDGHDRLTDSEVTVKGVRITGLDSLSAFDPFQAIGDYTLSNDLRWDKISIGANLTVDIKPSSLPDTLIIAPKEVQILEEINVNVELTLLDVGLSAFMAIDREKFDDLQLGSLLSTANVMPCLLSSMEAFELSELDVAVADLSVPELEGFISPGIDRIVTHLAEVAFAAYKPTLLRAMPGIFQKPVRRILKGQFTDGLLGASSETCETLVIPLEADGKPAELDFRDLFLESEEAKVLGGSGTAPYGSLGRLAYDLVQDGLQGIGSDGLPLVNEVMVRPATERQSGTAGTLRFPESLFDIEQSTAGVRNLEEDFFGGMDFSISDLRIVNVDTIIPSSFLTPTKEGTVLANSLSIGSSSRPLNMTMRLDAGVLDRQNSIDISISVDSLSLQADIHALMEANDFLSFPLGDALDLNCWLAALQPVDMDSNGLPVNPSAVKGLSIADLAIGIESLKVGTACISCQSFGTTLLPELQGIMESRGAYKTLASRVPEVIETIAKSANVQTSLDRMILSAPKFCPSHPNYDENAVREEFLSLGFPTLTTTSIDTMMYSGILAAQTAFVVFAETQRLKGVEATNPLSAQESFSAPIGSNLLDWTEMGNSTGLEGIADVVFGEFREFFGDDTNELFDLESFLQGMTNDEGFVDLETKIKFEQGDFSFQISSVRIKGLDSVSLFSVLEPIAPQTLQTSAAFEKVELELILSADAISTSEEPQVLNVKFSVEDVSADITLFAAFDVDRLGNLTLGSLLDTSSTFRCILSAAHEVSIPELNVAVGVFSPPEISGLMDDTSISANDVVSATFEQFESQITASIPVMFNGVIRDYFSALLDPTQGGCNTSIRPWAEDSFIDFRDLLLPSNEAALLGGTGASPYGDLPSTIYRYVRDELLSADDNGLAKINSIVISKLTETQSGLPGDLSFPGDMFNIATGLEAAGLDTYVRLRLSDIFVKNLDSFGTPLDLLEPTAKNFHLNNSAILGSSDPVSLGARFLLQLSGEDYELKNEVDISIDLDSLQIVLLGLAKISEMAFMQFPIKDITNLQCWLAAMPAPDLNAFGMMEEGEDLTLAVVEFLASVADIGLNVSCVECSGPRFSELSELIASPETSESATGAANAVFRLAKTLFEGNFLRVAVDRALNDARMRCPHSSTYDAEFKGVEYEPLELPTRNSPVGFFIAVVVVCALIVVVTSAVMLGTRLIVVKRHRAWVASLPSMTAKALAAEQNKEDQKAAEVNEISESMFQSEQIPSYLRLGMPLVILGNIAFFLSGHLSLGGSVSIIGSLAGEAFREDSFFEFSMASSTIELWKAGGRELAVLIFIFSFLWPYSKQLVTLALWFLPPSFVSVKTRGSVFLWLDFLGKWSMIDVFVLIVTIVAFRIAVTSPDVAFIPEDFYSLNLLVVPKWGLYANMTAQIISQLSSHFIIHYHRKIEEHYTNRLEVQGAVKHTDTEPMDFEEDVVSVDGQRQRNQRRQFANSNTTEAETLYSHAFRRPHRGETDKLVVKSQINPLIPVISVLVCILLVVGSAVPSYSLNVLGLLGLFVESGQGFEAAKTNFTLFSTIRLLMRQASLTEDISDLIGLGSLSILLVATVVLVPILQAGILLIQWFVALTGKQRRRLLVALEVLQAWQYAEVYLLAILVGSWQLGPVSEFMINPYCQPLHGFFAELSYYGVLKPEDAQCLRADVAVEPSFYVLFVATLLLSLLNSFVMKATTHYFHDKDFEASETAITLSNSFEINQLNDLSDYENYGDVDRSSIHPVPVLFTDRFRWLLFREDTMLSHRTNSDISKEGEQIESAIETPVPYEGAGDLIWEAEKPVDRVDY